MDNFNYREFIYGQSLFNSKEDDKQQLNENAPGYDNRKFGEALPTLETVQAAHEAKQIAEDDKVIKDLAQADEVIKMIKMMNPDVKADLLMKIARMGQDKMKESINEGDLFSSEFDRQELKAIINDLNKGLILDMPTRRAYKFLVSLLDKEDKEEMGLGEPSVRITNEQMYIDDDEFEMEMGRSKKDSLKKEMIFHVDQLLDGNIDMNDFMNVVEEIMAELKSMKEEDAIEDEPVTEDMFGPVKFLKSKGISDDVIKDFMKMHSKDIIGASEDEIMDEFENFRSVNYDYIDEDLKAHFKRFK